MEEIKVGQFGKIGENMVAFEMLICKKQKISIK